MTAISTLFTGIASTFSARQVARLNDELSIDELELAELMEREATPRLLIDDCPQVLNGKRNAVEKVIMHLDFLREDTSRYPTMAPKHLTAYVASQYGDLKTNLRDVLYTDSLAVNWKVAEQLEKRGYTVYHDRKLNVSKIVVGSSLLYV